MCPMLMRVLCFQSFMVFLVNLSAPIIIHISLVQILILSIGLSSKILTRLGALRLSYLF